jgi:hypothetical protein
MNMENEFLLYDFTVQEGDTIKSTAIDGALSHPDGITVRQIDEITLENGEKRKKIYFNETEPWIEGIGSTFGLFHDAMSHFANYSVSYLVCFKQNEIPLYVNTEKCLDGRCCELLNDTGINSLYPADKMVVLPNPTPGRATILLPENNRLENKIKIIDNTGQIIQTYLVRGNELKIDLSSYPAGMYYAIIDWDNPIQSYKIIKQ